MACSAARSSARWVTAAVSSSHRRACSPLLSSADGAYRSLATLSGRQLWTARGGSAGGAGTAVTLRGMTAVSSSSHVICKMSFHTSSPAAKQDFYQILGVPRAATQKEIKKAYYQYVMELTFAQAAKGVNKELTVNIEDACQRCGGRGHEPGSKVQHCGSCNGTGMETVNTGPFVMRSTCRRCGGRGSVITSPCTACRGTGQTKQRRTVTVPVPAGIEDGQTVRMPVGKKEIFITFRVQKSPIFRRDGADIHSDVMISVAQAILGGTVRAQGLYETINLSIPVGVQADQRIRLSGKGIPRVSGYGYGDHYVHIKIKIPKMLTDRQRALMRSYAEDETDVEGSVNGVTSTAAGKRSTGN
ncbi:hypothetical protein cypCar_00042395 [Cyprinus carpio]|nr:hypothetical protein cypCar_00042395 [Cyprinus carpio]